MVVGESEGFITGRFQHAHAARHFRAQRPPRRPQHQLLLVADRQRIGDKAEPFDVAAFATEAISRGATGGPAVVDDALAGLDDMTCRSVLADLAQRAEAGTLPQIVYLTGDVRVLAWAIGLPATVGGVAGAVSPTPEPER